MNDPRSDPNAFTLAWPVPRGMLMAADRLNYWRHAGAVAAGLKDGELRRGLDKDGRRMAAISKYTRLHRRSAMGPASPSAPPLTPAFALSRTRSLLRHKAYLDRVVFYWDFDLHTGDSWGVVLDYHRTGAGGRLPRRDVIGLSRAARNQARREADRWWAEGGHAPPPAEAPRGHRRIFEPRPAPTRAAPTRPYATGWRTLIDGRFVAVDVAGKHLEPAGGLGGR